MLEHVRMWDYAELYYQNGSRIQKCCLEFYTSNAFPNQKLSFATRMFLRLLYFERVAKPRACFLSPEYFL